MMCDDWGWPSDVDIKPSPSRSATERLLIRAGMHGDDLSKLCLLGHEDLADRIEIAVHHYNDHVTALVEHNVILERRADDAKKAAASLVARWVTAAFIGLVISAVIIMTHCVPVG